MLVSEYLRIVEETDQLEPKAPTNPNFKIMPVIGLAGEIGSLLTELKKEVREPHRRADFGTKQIEEELGDVVWYACTTARRARLAFASDILFANLRRISSVDPHRMQDSTSGLDDLRASIVADGQRTVETFDLYQRNAAKSVAPDYAELIFYLARIWKNCGGLLDQIDNAQSDFSAKEREAVAGALGDVMWYVAGFATQHGLSLDEIALKNADKAQSMFMPVAKRVPTPLHDERFGALEQFPRRFYVDFVSTAAETAVMLVNGVRMGDPLKDNAYQFDVGPGGTIDGYRFHDSIHLAFVAVLGWSPVVRDLMKRKRKSCRRVDDAEDGARARIVEEMVVKLTHSYAVGVSRSELLSGRHHVSMDLLKQIGAIIEGLEVSANKLWEWEKAILEGYGIFDQLRRHCRGRICVDLRARSVGFSCLADGEGERFPEPSV